MIDDTSLDVLVVGAGQAGLTAGYYLQQAGVRFLIVDGADEVGSAWSQRWESLVLFTPRRYNAMPGVAFGGDPDREPTRDEVIDYLHRYATELDLPVELNAPVTSLDFRDGRYAAEVPNRTILADQVIVATGPFQKPRIPAFASSVAADVYQAHSTGYRRPGDVPPGRAVVVGGGNTGYQIAEELAADHEVVLAVGSRQTPLPLRLLGRQIFWWGTKLGMLKVSIESRIGKRLSQRETLIGSSPRKAKRLGIVLKPRAVDASGRTVRFADGTQAEADADHLGDRLPTRLLLDHDSRRRCQRSRPSPPRRHRSHRPLLPRPDLAAHPRLGAARLRSRRREVHQPAGRRASSRLGSRAERERDMKAWILGSGGFVPTDRRETTCVLIRRGPAALVLDAGSGFQRLLTDSSLLDGATTLDVLLTHFHHDHIAGAPRPGCLQRKAPRPMRAALHRRRTPDGSRSFHLNPELTDEAALLLDARQHMAETVVGQDGVRLDL